MSKKISELTAATTPLAGTELVEIVQGGVSKKVSASYLAGATGGRELVTSNRTYYVRPDGSDSNTGLTNTSGGGFLTIQKAINTVAGSLDIAAGVTVTIQVADGTYTGSNALRPFVGAGSVTIQGNSTTPANVVISTTSAHCFATSGKAVYTIKDMKLQTATSGWAIVCAGGATITHSNLNFGACASGHMYVSQGGVISSSASYAISGGSPVHVQASILGAWQSTGGTVTLTGTPAFSTGFAVASNVSAIYAGGTTYSGSATGKRYDATLNATVSSNGGGANFFPGDVAGTTATGGQYA